MIAPQRTIHRVLWLLLAPLLLALLLYFGVFQPANTPLPANAGITDLPTLPGRGLPP